MNVLVVGSGGREHALAWALAQDPQVSALYAAPGNPGIARIATCLPVPALALDRIAAEARRLAVDLVVVGPEDPIAAGLVDVLTAQGLRALGPSRAAAVLEASKPFMKGLCRRYDIPTAAYQVFDDPASAASYCRTAGRPLVVKAEGLTAGKGVVVARTADEAVAAIDAMMVRGRFGDAGRRVVIEEVLEGDELSVFALCDGTNAVPLLPARDHKRLLDGDRGPNTGGMGAYAPVPSVGQAVLDRITDEILGPAVWAMAQEGRPYRGFLFAGIMLTPDGPQVLEFNSRLGDPEAQVLMPLLSSSLVEAADAVLAGRLDGWAPRWRAGYAVSVALCAAGYPDRPEAGAEIRGLDAAAARDGAVVFHAGTAARDGRVVASGGRVVHVVGTAPTLREARARAYRAADAVTFGGRNFRRDIAARDAGECDEVDGRTSRAPLAGHAGGDDATAASAGCSELDKRTSRAPLAGHAGGRDATEEVTVS